MLAIEVTLLTGRYVATAPSDRNAAEWPPAPARLFSAMVAAWASEDDRPTDEADVLRWLERQPAPSIAASPSAERRVVTHYVPVNDVAVVRTYGDKALKVAELKANGPKAAAKIAKLRQVDALVNDAGRTTAGTALEMFPDHRPRQPRAYPSVTPDDPVITYVWPVEVPDGLAELLDGLLAKVHRIGHSSSLVSVRVVAEPDRVPTFVPDPAGEATLRWVRPGQFDALELLHAQHQGTRPRSLPSRAVRYRPVAGAQPQRPVQADVPARWTVLEVGTAQRRPRATDVAAITRALRDTILSYLPAQAPEAVTGHASDGSPTRLTHAGFLALPWVGMHGSGSVLGLAVAAPDEASEQVLLDALAAWFSADDRPSVVAGRAGRWPVRSASGTATWTLRPGRWAAPSTTWVTATPIALPRHPGDLRASDPAARALAWERAEAGVVDSCRHIGLPDPVEITVDRQPLLVGTVPCTAFPTFRQRGRNGADVARALVHARVRFAEPVRGPVLLGAGRFLGLGLMAPLTDHDEEEHRG